MRSTLAIVLVTALSFAVTTAVSAQKGQGGGPKVKTTSAPKAQGGGSKAQGGGSKAQGGPKATTSTTTTVRAHGGPKAKTTTASGGSKKTTTSTTTASSKNPKKSGSSTAVASTSTSSTTSPTSTATSTTSTGDTNVTLTPVQQKLKKNTNLASKLENRLPPGTNLMDAAEGFRNLGQFVAAVNVSNNLGLTFTELKSRMVDDGMSLGQAIKAERADMADTTTVANRAQTEANQLIASTETSTTATASVSASTNTTTTTSTTNTSTKKTKTKKSGGQ